VDHPHPASQLLLGLSVLLVASSRHGMELSLAFLLLALVAIIAARVHLFLLVRRSRWLLLAMLLMFGWMTPGTPLPGLPGATREGLLLAVDNVERFLITLAVVALILKALPPVQLVAGIRSLLAPLALLNLSRDRIAVRLALTMQEVEASRNGDCGSQHPAERVLLLPTKAFAATDLLIALISAALLFFAWLA
jgi:energy-coupling factor transport system permease protein